MSSRLKVRGALNRSSKFVPDGRTICFPGLAKIQTSPPPAPARLPIPTPFTTCPLAAPAMVPTSAPVIVVSATLPALSPLDEAPSIFDSLGWNPSRPVPPNPESVARRASVVPLGKIRVSNRIPICALPFECPGRTTFVTDPFTELPTGITILLPTVMGKIVSQ